MDATKPLFIFDLDGTIALIDHRRPILEDTRNSRRFTQFEAACIYDKPNLPVITTMEMLRRVGAEIWFFSGRKSDVREQTVAWLTKHTSFLTYELDNILVMRHYDDFRSDDVVKREFYDNMLIDDRRRLVAIFDDRIQVVQMWRSIGVACFQVAEGNF